MGAQPGSPVGSWMEGGEAPWVTYVSVPVDLCVKSIRGPIRFLLQHIGKENFRALNCGHKTTADLTRVRSARRGCAGAAAAAHAGTTESCSARAHQHFPFLGSLPHQRAKRLFLFERSLAEPTTFLKEEK